MSTVTPFVVTPILILFAILLGQHDPSSTHMDERPPNPPAYRIKPFASNSQSAPQVLREPLTGPASEDTPPNLPTPLAILPKLPPALDEAVAACEQRPDRYDWQSYALAAGFPPEVVAGAEMATVIQTESGGDLCAVNTSSMAACWAQILSSAGEQQQIAYLDPSTCMAAAYAKWLDGGGGFYSHWYQWWQ
jgi:hypothetical protein